MDRPPPPLSRHPRRLDAQSNIFSLSFSLPLGSAMYSVPVSEDSHTPFTHEIPVSRGVLSAPSTPSSRLPPLPPLFVPSLVSISWIALPLSFSRYSAATDPLSPRTPGRQPRMEWPMARRWSRASQSFFLGWLVAEVATTAPHPRTDAGEPCLHLRPVFLSPPPRLMQLTTTTTNARTGPA